MSIGVFSDAIQLSNEANAMVPGQVLEYQVSVLSISYQVSVSSIPYQYLISEPG